MFDKRKFRLEGRKIIPSRCPTEKYDCGTCTYFEGCSIDIIYCAYRECLSGDDRYHR